MASCRTCWWRDCESWCSNPDCPHYIDDLDQSCREWVNRHIGEEPGMRELRVSLDGLMRIVMEAEGDYFPFSRWS